MKVSVFVCDGCKRASLVPKGWFYLQRAGDSLVIGAKGSDGRSYCGLRCLLAAVEESAEAIMKEG